MAVSMAASHNQLSRAAALRESLEASEQLAREANQVLEGYSIHLNSLIESVEHVATRAQVTAA